MWAYHAINYLFFLLEAATIFIEIIIALNFVLASPSKDNAVNKKGQLVVKSLNKISQQRQEQLAQEFLSKSAYQKKLKLGYKAQSSPYILDKCKLDALKLFYIEYKIKKSKTLSLRHVTLRLFQRVGP